MNAKTLAISIKTNPNLDQTTDPNQDTTNRLRLLMTTCYIDSSIKTMTMSTKWGYQSSQPKNKQ